VILFAAVVTLATLGTGVAAALALTRVRSLPLQLVLFALLAVALPLLAVTLSGVVMFSSGHDLTILFVAAAASTAAAVGGLLIARAIARPVENLRRASAELADGELAARAVPQGPAELRDLALTFNEMASNLEGLFDARRQLVAWASHDLRAPLASMQAMLEALEDGLAEPSRYLPALRDQVRTLGRLVDDLFELARIDAGAITLNVREAPLDRLVRACLLGVEAEAEARHVSVQALVAEHLPPVRCAPDQVQRILLNLLTNALRHTPSDGSVAVLVEPIDPAEVRVTVEDTGEGIPAGAEQRIFDRFWRGDRARTPGRGGTGLGLAIARGLVEAQGGRIWAESRPEGGARISFTLPAA
jgi:two-component system, OmpR family, sensor histidine kinase SaeS